MNASQLVLFPGLPLPMDRSPRPDGKTGYNAVAKGYARPPGTGPAGETCKTCAHYCRVQGGGSKFPKCALIRFRWTHGPGTDIRAKSPACELWQAKPKAV